MYCKFYRDAVLQTIKSGFLSFEPEVQDYKKDGLYIDIIIVINSIIIKRIDRE